LPPYGGEFSFLLDHGEDFNTFGTLSVAVEPWPSTISRSFCVDVTRAENRKDLQRHIMVRKKMWPFVKKPSEEEFFVLT